jgi:PKD repeat protein
VARLGADVYSGKAPLQVMFNSSASSDPDGVILYYSWDLDGSSLAEGRDLVYIFDNPGSYRVTLTVTDDQGLSASDSVNIRVRKGKRK